MQCKIWNLYLVFLNIHIYFPGQPECDRRRNSSAPNDVIVLPEGIDDVKCDKDDNANVTPEPPVVPSFPTPSNITEANATSWCRSELEGSGVYVVCKDQMGKAFPVDDFVYQCVEDVKVIIQLDVS